MTPPLHALQRLGHRALVASVAARWPGHFGFCGSACRTNALKKYDGQAVSGKIICNREKEQAARNRG